MTNRETRRAAAKSLRSAGIDPNTMFVRYDFEPAAVDAYLEGANDDGHWADLVADRVNDGLRRLEADGGNARFHSVVTIGDHPKNPGGITIEVKCLPIKKEA